MRYPNFPSKGDSVGICATSAGVGHKIESFELSEDSITALGLTVKETSSVRTDGIRAASGITRAHELNSLFLDNEITAIIAASGGEYNFEMLPYVDWEAISSNPKWFAGYSDPTTISFCMTTKLDIATIYGFNGGSFDWRPLHEFQKNALGVLCGDIRTQHSYDYYDSCKDFSEDTHEMDAPVFWELYVPDGDTRIDITGRLIGGCIEIIDNLAGTEFEDTASFIERYKEDGFIWYFDVFAMDPINLYLKLLKLKYMGYFRYAKAVVFGRVMFPGESIDEEYLENLDMVFSDIPYVWNADIGHTKPSMTLINGSIAHLTVEDGAATLDMILG